MLRSTRLFSFRHAVRAVLTTPALCFVGCTAGAVPSGASSAGNSEGGITPTPAGAGADAGPPSVAPAADASATQVIYVGVRPAADAAADATGTAACDPTKGPKDNPCVVSDAYGVFVASSVEADAGSEAGAPDGSMRHPYPTVSGALAHLGGKSRVYVCDGTYHEQVTITVPVSVYGGLSCTNGWVWDGAATQVSSPSPAFALSVTGLNNTTPVVLEDLAFSTGNASGQDAIGNGLSSMAGVVSRSAVNFVRVVLSAGNGADGAAGENGSSAASTTGNTNYDVTLASAPTTTGTPSDRSTTGVPGQNTCADGSTSAGGLGALGGAYTTGSAGQASPAPSLPAAQGHDGSGGTLGQDGAPGQDGDPGASPAASATYGSIVTSPSVAWLPAAGSPGANGGPGQGGGGSGAYSPASTVVLPGISGNAGGCGGAGGTSGGGGGASLALLVYQSSVSLADCTIQTGTGGQGGRGGTGQPGQTAAPVTHPPNIPTTVEGGGGQGGGGSGAQGGAAGISAGLVYEGTLPTYDAATAFATTPGRTRASRGPGAGGAGAPGGNGQTTNAGAQGSDGYAHQNGSAAASAVYEVLRAPFDGT